MPSRKRSAAWLFAGLACGALLLCGCSADEEHQPTPAGGAGSGGVGGSTGAGGSAGGAGGAGGTGGTPAPPWVRTFGGPLSDHAMAVQRAPNGDLVLCGVFADSVELGGTQLTSAGAHDLLVAKLSADGLLLWAKAIGGPGMELEPSVAVGPAGEVVLSGDFTDVVHIDGSTSFQSQGSSDMILVSFAADGSLRWARAFGGPGQEFGPRVAIDSSGDVLFAGPFEEVVDFGGGPLAAVSANDVVVGKLSGDDGAHLWSRAFGGGAGENAHGIAVSQADDVAVTGWFANSIDFGGGPLLQGGIFVAKLAGEDGAHVWSRAVGGDGNNGGCGLSFNAAGELLCSGWFQNTQDFGGGPIAAADHSDAFVTLMDGQTGDHVWSHGYGGQGVDSSCAVAATGDGDWLVGGPFQQQIDLGGGALLADGPGDGFIARLAGANGAHQWSLRLGGPSGDHVEGLLALPGGSVVVSGSFTGQVDFWGEPHAAAGESDGFIAHFLPE